MTTHLNPYDLIFIQLRIEQVNITESILNFICWGFVVEVDYRGLLYGQSGYDWLGSNSTALGGNGWAGLKEGSRIKLKERARQEEHKKCS